MVFYILENQCNNVPNRKMIMINHISRSFRIVLLMVLIFPFSVLLFAQEANDQVDKESGKYLYGVGEGNTREEADKRALAALASKISVNVESSFSNIENEVNKNGALSSNTAVESVIKTYSNIPNLPFVETQVEEEYEREDYSYFRICRYIKKSEVNKIFEARSKKVLSMLKLADKAEGNSKIDVALQNYYWAYCLLKGSPYANDVVHEETGDPLMVWIPNRINTILGDIKAEKVRKEGNNVIIRITYKDYDLSSLEYTYWDGRRHVRTEAKDGLGTMDMISGASTEHLKIKCELEFMEEAKRDEEIEAVLQTMKGNPFPKATINVTGKFKTGKPNEKDRENDDDGFTLNLAEQASIMEDEVDLSIINEEKDLSQYSTVMDAVVRAIRTKNYESVSNYFTDRGKEMFDGLLKYGNARIVANPDFSYLRFGDQVICRSLKMCFAFKNNTRTFTENVNFTFNNEGLIEWIAFGLSEETSQGILLNKNYTETARILLTLFLENYKTAFALKDIDYIESIFDDNALIITGTVVKQASYSKKDEKKFQKNEIIKYNKYSKTEYLEKLRKTFSSNEYVNIRFADIDISKAGPKYGELYGVQVKQDYFSSRYGDSGYLYLQINFNDFDKPLIEVRTWQPERMIEIDSSFRLYGMGDF